MKRRITRILGIGLFAVIALIAVTRWLTWRNRYVTNAELQAQATLDYEKKNAANLAMMQGPGWRLGELDEKYQGAAKAVEVALVSQKEDPSKFRVRVFEEDAGATLVFSLQHVDDFLPKNRGAIGNPSGKDRWIEYDIRSAKVTRIAFQQ